MKKYVCEKKNRFLTFRKKVMGFEFFWLEKFRIKLIFFFKMDKMTKLLNYEKNDACEILSKSDQKKCRKFRNWT